MAGMPPNPNMGMAWASQFVPPPMMGMTMPSQYYPMPQQMQNPASLPGSFGEVCFKCNQPGHVAHACPMALMRGFQGDGGGGNRRNGRPKKVEGGDNIHLNNNCVLHEILLSTFVLTCMNLTEACV